MTQPETWTADTPPIKKLARSIYASYDKHIRASGKRDLRHSMQYRESAVPAVPGCCVAEKGVEASGSAFMDLCISVAKSSRGVLRADSSTGAPMLLWES